MNCVESHFKILLFTALLFLVGACGLFSKNDAGVPGTQSGICSVDDPEFRNAFKGTLHPSLQKACYECHNSQPNKAPSPFADESPSTAMEFAKRFADFNSPANSAFVKRMEQGHNCGSNCGALAQEFAEKVAEWKTAMGGSISKLVEDCSGLKDHDDAKIIRTGVKHINPSFTAGTTLVFDLKDATPPLPGATFQVKVRPFTSPTPTNPGTYIIEQPVLAVAPLTGIPNQNVRIANIHILINGTERDEVRNWVSTNFIVQPRQYPAGTEIFGWYIVKDATQSITWSSPGGDDLSFDLKISVTNLLWNIPRTDSFNCKSLGAFASFYNAKYNDCIGCHQSGGAGYPFFPMKNAADAEVCRNFKMRSNPNDPLTSLFYLMPQDKIPSYRHPVSIAFTVAEEDAIKAWLEGEK